MENLTSFQSNRRQFITKIVPACAVTCVASSKAFALFQSDTKTNHSEQKHKFEKIYEQELTYSRVWSMQFSRIIDLAKALEKELGKDNMIEFLKKYTSERMLNYGKRQASNLHDNSFRAYTDMFRNTKKSFCQHK